MVRSSQSLPASDLHNDFLEQIALLAGSVSIAKISA
jgi:hypothetical protein